MVGIERGSALRGAYEALSRPEKGWPQPPLEDPSWLPANLDELLLASVAKHGDRVLLEYFEEGRQVTYSEFGNLVDHLTAVLLAVGVETGDRIAVMLPNIPEFPALTFAIGRLRAITVPLNTRYTHREVDFVVEDAGASVLIVHDTLLPGLAGSETLSRLDREHVLVVGDGDGELDATKVSDLVASTAPTDSHVNTATLDDVCHIQFTSGTTGLPKGCILTHRYWLIPVAAGELTTEPDADLVGKRTLTTTPYFYMGGPMGVMGTMNSGGTLLVPRSPSLQRYMSWIHEQQVDSAVFPVQLLKLPPSELDRGHKIKTAMVYYASAEQRAEFKRRFGIVGGNLWSMTETGIGTMVPWDEAEFQNADSVGFPLPFREFKVVDDTMTEVPTGEVGELCVRGPGLFVGYYNRPEANAEAFLEGGWFRTGDRARLDADGRVFFLGRAKDMVRRAGENVSAVEVENVISDMPEILQAAVVPVPDEWREEEVKAYVVLAPSIVSEDESPECTLPPEQIFAWCQERLASFKVPRYLEYRESLPMTPSDKVAKGQLVKEKDDLRVGSYDRVDGVWR